MQSKRLLLLTDDAFIGRYYQGKLKSAGFNVETTDDLSLGLELLAATKPDLLVVDLMLRGPNGEEPITEMREHPNGAQIPILALPTPHFAIAQRAAELPGVRLLISDSHPLGELLKVAAETLGLPAHDGSSLMLFTLPDEDTKLQAASAAQESLSRLRHDLHQIMRGETNGEQLHEILRSVHHFAGRTSLLNRTALSHIARAVEALVFHLERLQGRVDPSTMRTLGQAADFLAQLLDDKTYSRVPDFNAAKIVVIEDEATARDLIITAMEMVGLQASGSENPRLGLSMLGTMPCDLIFLDINLPEMNGFELCNKVRALPIHERTPIVFLTGMNSFQNRVQSSLSGGNDFVGKPFNVAELGVKALIWVMKGRLGLN